MTAAGNLLDLLTECLVEVHVDGEFRGTGFFVAESLVLTCAHVVCGAERIELRRQDRALPARLTNAVPAGPDDGQFYPLPDLALLTVDDHQRLAHESVLLAEHEPDHRAQVTATGFSEDTPKRPAIAIDTRTLTVSGPAAQRGCLNVTASGLPEGMSGSPVLDERSGRIIGLVKASRDRHGNQGGWIVTITAIATHLPEIIEANRACRGRWHQLFDKRQELITLLANDQLQLGPLGTDSPPSHFLDPRRKIVDFYDRPQLDELADWCRAAEAPMVRLVCGPGGVGKTRLALRLCEQFDGSEGWVAGRLRLESEPSFTYLHELLQTGRVLLVIDYAESRVSMLQNLLAELAISRPPEVRILLLSRAAGTWWRGLVRKSKGLLGIEPMRLGALGDQQAREAAVLAAYEAFRQAVPGVADLGEPSPWVRPVLVDSAARETSVLLLHARALAVVFWERGPGHAATAPPTTFRDPLRDMLEHERKLWVRTVSDRHIEIMPGRRLDEVLIDQLLVLPTLFSARDDIQATDAVTRVLEREGYLTGHAARLASLLAELYPDPDASAERYWAPLQPDRLGETLLVDVLDQAAEDNHAYRFLAAALAHCDVEQAVAATTVLARAGGLTESDVDGARDSGDVGVRRAAQAIEPLVKDYPGPFLPAAVTLAASLSDPGGLPAMIESHLGSANQSTLVAAGRRVTQNEKLRPLAVAIWRRVIERAEEQKGVHDSEIAELAEAYDELGYLLAAGDEDEQARACYLREVDLFTKLLYTRRLTDYRSRLGYAAQRLAACSQRLGRQTDALREIDQAVAAFEQLNDEAQGLWATELANARRFRAQILRGVGRLPEARAEDVRAVGILQTVFLQFQQETLEIDPGSGETSVPSREATVSSAVDDEVVDDRTAALVVPIGHFAGPMYIAVNAQAPESFEVRFRDGVFSLSAVEYAVWAVAHGDPNKVARFRNTRARVLAAAAAAGVEEPEPVFDSLVTDGLLATIAPEPGSARRLAQSHRLIPLALGLGNSPQNPAEFQIGLPNAARVSVGYDVYHMWLFAHRAESMWAAVSTIADGARESNQEKLEPGSSDGIQLVDDPDELLKALLSALPVLISTSCAFIDTV